MIYRLHVDHIYQRRFGQKELAEALRASHWYIISRRPCVRIVENSANLADRILTVDVATSHDFTTPRVVETLGLDFGEYKSLKNFQSYLSGSYFSVEANGRLIHGDAWSLSSMLSNANPRLAAQEILYIGQAFGTDGSSNAWRRVQAHDKLQRIYEDHADMDCDIFVAPLSLERRAWTSDDHIDDDEPGPDFGKYYEHFAHLTGEIRKASVDLVEHGLISHFVPHYNEKLHEWRRDTPTQSMQLMREAGFRLLHIHLSGWWGLARFHSQAAPDKFRSHLISHDLPPAASPAGIRGVSAEQLSEWRHEAMMIREGQDLLEEAAERTGAAIRVFGKEAPALRTPPGITLPAIPQLAHGASAAQHALRKELNDRREELRQARAPIPHPGVSTYDPNTGTIVIGQFQDGTLHRVPLLDPSSGKTASMVVFGDTDSGRSNHLLVVLNEAIMTGFFVPAVANVKIKDNLRNIVPDDGKRGLYTEGVADTINLLEAMLAIIDQRTNEEDLQTPTGGTPGILLAIDDADELLHTEEGANLIQEILTKGGRRRNRNPAHPRRHTSIRIQTRTHAIPGGS